MTTMYERLSAGFDKHFQDVRGGVRLTYVTGEQVVSRLNDVLGPGGWSFNIMHQEIHAEADEAWCLGKLTADIDGQRVEREQFGSQKLKRSRSTGAPLDIGFDLKGAATDALKKCATLIGVGLYLSEKEGGVEQPKPAPEPMVTHPEDKLYQRYMVLVEEAQQLEVEYEAPQLPMPVAALRAAGVDLKARVDAAKKAAV